MRNIIYILLLLPCFAFSQAGEDMLVLSKRQSECHAPGNINPSGTAISDCSSATSSISGWSNNGVVRSAVYVEGFGYVMDIETSTTNTSPRIERTITKENGETYKVSFWFRMMPGIVAGGKGAFTWTGWSNWSNINFNSYSVNEWHYVEVTGLESNSSETIVRFYPNTGYEALGNKIQIWNLKIIKTS